MNTFQVFQDIFTKREKQCVMVYCGRPRPGE